MLRQADGSCNAKAGLRAQSVRRTGEAGYRARSLLRRGRFWRAALQCNYCRRHRVLARNSAWALLATANDLRHIDAICGVTIPVVGTVCLSRPINARVKTTGTSRVLESLRPGSQTTPLIPVRNCRRMRRVHDISNSTRTIRTTARQVRSKPSSRSRSLRRCGILRPRKSRGRSDDQPQSASDFCATLARS